MGTQQTDRLVVAEIVGVSKSYPGVVALDRVDFVARTREIHGLVGENGAGKSTLIKILSAVEMPDAGEFRTRPFERGPRDPHEALAMGISVVHQEPGLISSFNVAENILADAVVGRAGRFINQRALTSRARDLIDLVELNVAPTTDVRRLSRAQQQLVEIARALSTSARILLLDEPTASISATEAEALHRILRRLCADGTAVVYVSHKIEDVLELCDVVTVLRDGRNAGAPSTPVGELSAPTLMNRMIGRVSELPAMPSRTKPMGAIVLRADRLTGSASPIPLSFTLREGEILGWYGLVGSGRTEVARALIGVDQVTGGAILVSELPVRIGSMSAALHEANIGYVTENRHEEGLFLEHSISRNITSTVWDRLQRRFGFADPVRENGVAEAYRVDLGMKAAHVSQLVSTLSGGTQQKVSLSKWLAADPKVLIVDEPTVGIDIHTKFDIHALLAGLAARGLGVIMISSDLAEVIRVSDRVMVFRSSRVVGELENSHDYDTMSETIMGMITASSRNPTTQAQTGASRA